MNRLKNALLIGPFALNLSPAFAVEFEPLGKAVQAALGTPKAFKKSVEVGGAKQDYFYSKGEGDKPKTLAFVQKGIYEPNCTHTWVVAIDAATTKVSDVRVVEMSCPHAFPTKEASYLAQYKGRSPAQAATLDKDVQAVAKATGSSKLTTDAVKTSLVAAKAALGH